MKRVIALFLLAGLSGSLFAEVVVGVSVSTTGPGASLGVHVSNTVSLLPKNIAGESIRYVTLDDASDPTTGAKNARRFATDEKVDAIIGSSTVPVALAQAAVANESKTPFIALSPIVVDAAKQPYVFVVPQPVPFMAEAVIEHMHAHGVKNAGYIGFSDAWGDANFGALKSGGAAVGINVSGDERYSRTDTSVGSQVLKVLATNPDAVFVGASGTPAALPQIAAVGRGYRKQIYHTSGAVNRDFIKVGGKSVEGVIAPTGPMVVAEQLPTDHPLRAVGVEFLKLYESAYGVGSRNAFAGYAWDAGAILQAALPVALKSGKPGTPEFRKAFRDAIESGKDVKGTHAFYNMSPSDHYGVDRRARVLVRVENGDWKLVR